MNTGALNNASQLIDFKFSKCRDEFNPRRPIFPERAGRKMLHAFIRDSVFSKNGSLIWSLSLAMNSGKFKNRPLGTLLPLVMKITVEASKRGDVQNVKSHSLWHITGAIGEYPALSLISNIMKHLIFARQRLHSFRRMQNLHDSKYCFTTDPNCTIGFGSAIRKKWEVLWAQIVEKSDTDLMREWNSGKPRIQKMWKRSQWWKSEKWPN